MDRKAHCTDLLKFHVWRQHEIAAVLRSVDTEFFSKQLSGSFGSLFIVLKHLVWAEKVWLGRVRNNEVATMREVTPGELIDNWVAVSAKWMMVVNETDEAGFDQPISYFNTKGDVFQNTLFDIIIHFVDHSTYHIGQMMNALRAFEIEPVSTNYIHYLRAINE